MSDRILGQKLCAAEARIGELNKKLRDSTSKLESREKDHANTQKRLDIRERTLKMLQAAATKEEKVAAALDAQAQDTLYMVQGLQNLNSQYEKRIAAQQAENEYLKWRVEHDLKHEECARELQELVDTMLKENQRLEEELAKK